MFKTAKTIFGLQQSFTENASVCTFFNLHFVCKYSGGTFKKATVQFLFRKVHYRYHFFSKIPSCQDLFCDKSFRSLKKIPMKFLLDVDIKKGSFSVKVGSSVSKSRNAHIFTTDKDNQKEHKTMPMSNTLFQQIISKTTAGVQGIQVVE